MSILYILGRQPDIGIAELESLYGPEPLRIVSKFAAVCDQTSVVVPFSRIGGSTRSCKVLTSLPYTDWNKIEGYLAEQVPNFMQYLPDGKLNVGVSVYGLRVTPKKINVSGLKLKKIIKSHGKSVRIVPNKTLELNSAQVIHNRLTGKNGWELVLVKDGQQTILAQTTDIQDIEAYAARDQARPMRDAKVGMLPPKLAQVIINCAAQGNNRYGAVVLDPFCGTGVLLQEAGLIGFNAIGSDIDERMVEYSKVNLDWLKEKLNLDAFDFKVSQSDATNGTWDGFDFVGCETYLGRPFSQEPTRDVLQKVMQDVETIHRKFLQNLAKQTQKGLRLCIAIPAWNIGGKFMHLKTLDSLEELGYTRQSFVHADDSKLIYHREGQIVGRELVVLTRK